MQKGNPWALLPIAVFLVVFIGCGILFGDFYAMPAIVGFLIALVTAFPAKSRAHLCGKAFQCHAEHGR